MAGTSLARLRHNLISSPDDVMPVDLLEEVNERHTRRQREHRP